MENLKELYSVLEKADAAGDEEAVAELIPYIKQVEAAQAQKTTEEQPVDVTQPPSDLTKAPKVVSQAPIDVMGQKFTPEEYARYSGMPIAAKPGEQAKGAFSGSFGRSIYNLAADLALAQGKVTGNTAEAEATAKRLRDYGNKTYTDTTKGWKEDPLAKIQELAGGSAPYMIGPIAAALGSTALGATGAAAVAAPLLTSATQFTGSNLQRQMDQNKKLEDTSLLKAGALAIPQAALDQIGFRFIPGVKRLFGAAGKEITDEAANALIKKSILAKAGEKALATGEAMTVEGGTEAAQQLLERLQAGLSITSPEALQEYFDSFIGGAALAGVLGTAGHAVESIASRFPETPEKETTEKPLEEPPLTEEKRPSRDTLKRQFKKSAEEKANEINKAKVADINLPTITQAGATADQGKLFNVVGGPSVEVGKPIIVGPLDDATLTSWGIKKNSNAFKALKGVDASTPEGRDLVDKTLEAYPGKLNEDAINTFTSTLDQQKEEAPDARIDLGTIRISDEVLGGQKYGTPSGTPGRYGPTTDISGGITRVDQAREGAGDVTLKEPKTLPTGERFLSIQELLNDPNPQQRRAARRKFIDMFETDQANELIKEEAKVEREERAKLAKLKKTQYPIADQSTNLANILGTLKDKPNYLIEDLKNPDVTDAERNELNQHARDYLLAESLRNKYKVRMTPEEVAALEKEGETITRKEKPLSEDEFKDLQEEYLARQAKEQEPLEARGEIKETGETPESIEGAFQKQYGKNVGLAKKRGLLKFLKDASELPPEIGKVSPTTKAVYHKGVGYFITNRITKADAPRMLLHEIGVHYGLEGMLGTANYKRIVKQIKQRHLTDKELKAAWDNTVETYPEYAEGSDNFMQEVIANIGETAPNNTIWRQIVGYIKQFLSKLGYGWDINKITADDIRDMVQHSVRMSLAGKIKPTTTGVALTSEETGAPKPTYYSQLARTITNATFPRGVTTQPAAQWLTWLNSKMSEGIKKDELEFSGITDYLKMRGNDKVDKQELITYLENNGPQVKEIKLGVDEEGRYNDTETRDAWVEEHLQEWIEYNYGDDPEQKLWENAGEQAVDNYDFPYYVKEENVTDADGNKGYRVYMTHWTTGPIDDTYYFSEDEAQAVADDENNNGIESYAEEVYRELKRDYERALEHQREELEADFEHYYSDTTDTKYNSVTLAGGNHKYAEIILQLLPRDTVYMPKNIGVTENNYGLWQMYDKDTGVVFGDKRYHSEAEATADLPSYEGISYTLPGNEKPKFTHFHWDDLANPVAHYRVNQRMDKTGARVLFVEEIQSDWAQMPKTLRKRHIRKLAKQYGIKPEQMAEFVPGDWGFKRELSKDQQKQVDDLKKQIEDLKEKRNKLRQQEKAAYDVKQSSLNLLVNNIKQLKPDLLASGSSAMYVANSLINPRPDGYASKSDEKLFKSLSSIPQIKELVNLVREFRDKEKSYNNEESNISFQLNTATFKLDELGTQDNKIERGPWVQDTEAWSNLILKNIVRFAVDQGYEKVAFVNGLQAAYKGGRLDQFEEVFITRNQSDLYDIHAILKDSGGETRTIPNIPDEQLEEYVGNIADRARELQPGETDGWDADKIQVASKGMKEFYDVYIPRYMGKLLKKLGGGNLETVSFEAPNPYAPPEQRIGDQIGFTITPEMANKALQGQTLFARASKKELDEDLKKSGTVGKIDKGFPTLWERFTDSPIKTIDEIVADVRKSLFSFDASQNNKMMIAAKKMGLSPKEIADMIYTTRISQAVKADQLADMWMVHGGIEYDPQSFSFAIKDLANSMSTIREDLKVLAKKYGVSEYEMYQYGNAAFVSARSRDLTNHNNRLYRRVVKLYAKGNKAAGDKAADNYKLVHQTQAEIKRGLKFFKTIPELKKIAKTWNINRTRLLNFAVDSGLYSREKAEDLIDVIHYVPFFRDKQIEARKGPNLYKRGLLDAATDKRLKGSYQPVHNVFANMELWSKYIFKKSLTNKIAQEKTKYYSKLLPDDIKVLRNERSATGNTVAIWQNGKLVRYEFQGYDGESMVDAYTGLEPVTMVPGAALFRPFNTFLRAQIVLEPLFNVAQIPMDMFNAMFSSGVNVSLAIPLQVAKEIILTPLGLSSARKYLSARAATGKHDFSSEYEVIDINAMKEVKEVTKMGKLLEYAAAPFKATLKGLRFFGMASDNVIRQAVFSQIMLETGNVARATQAAEEIINFRRTGSSAVVNYTRQNAIFVNANLQSMNIAFGTIMLSDITPDSKLVQARRLLLNGAQVIMAILAITAMNADDDDYKKIDPKDRDNYIVLPGTGGYKLPLRGDILTLLFKILPEHLYNRYIAESEDSEKMKLALSRAFKKAITFPSPFPNLLTSIVEQSLNFDFVTGRPLVGRGQEGLAPELQFSNKYTSQFAKWVAEGSKEIGAEVSPASVQHFMNRWLASTSLLVGMFTNSIIAQIRKDILPELTTKQTLLQIPNMGKFVSKDENTRNINDLYELNDLVNSVVETANKYDTLGDHAKFREFLEKDHNQQLYNLKKELATISRDLANLREWENRVYYSKDTGRWTPQTKRQELDRIEATRQRILGHEQGVKAAVDRRIQNLRRQGGL